MYCDVSVQKIKCKFIVTSDKRIQFTTIEQESEAHHKFNHMVAYTRAHSSVL
jgi:hypothetical protein